MDIDIAIHTGNKDKPVVIFVHGLAMDKDIWINPLETRAFAKNVPLKYIAAKKPIPLSRKPAKMFTTGRIPEQVETLWDVLKGENYNLVSWSQRRPVGPIGAAVDDLAQVMTRLKRVFPGGPKAFICHSRGGLIARKFLESKQTELKALITLATPHAGSSLSKIGKFISPFSPFLKGLMPRTSHGAISRIIKNVKELVEGSALRELMPDSDFIRNLNDVPAKGVHYLSFGGKKAEIASLYGWERQDDRFVPKKLFSIPDSLLKFIPVSAIPEEIITGKGDIMVTAKSSVLPWAEEHYNLSANHFTILWNKKVIEKTRAVLRLL